MFCIVSVPTSLCKNLSDHGIRNMFPLPTSTFDLRAWLYECVTPCNGREAPFPWCKEDGVVICLAKEAALIQCDVRMNRRGVCVSSGTGQGSEMMVVWGDSATVLICGEFACRGD